MPDKRKHRGPAPGDEVLFGTEATPRLEAALEDLCWLRARGYASASSVKLVGDRFQLTERQRTALQRCACPAAAARSRQARELGSIAGAELMIDGYNLLTTVEAALAGGFIFIGRDGCCRDLASLHGTFHRVLETLPALGVIADKLRQLGAGPTVWLLDRPVSNSGRLAGLIREVGEQQGSPWAVELVTNPDPVLAETQSVVVTSDSVVLDSCLRWFNLARRIIEEEIPRARIAAFSRSQ